MNELYTSVQATCDAERFTRCDTQELKAQIGMMNILAISGGRVIHRSTGITLPVSSGYKVTVDLAAGDTYTVRRIMTRGAKTWIKGEVNGVYCDMVGEMAYQASSYKSYSFPKEQS